MSLQMMFADKSGSLSAARLHHTVGRQMQKVMQMKASPDAPAGIHVKGVKKRSNLFDLPYWDHIQQAILGAAHLLRNVGLRIIACVTGRVCVLILFCEMFILIT